MSHIQIKATKPGSYSVSYEGRVHLGHIFSKEDGFYDFWPNLSGGYWSAYILREIADKLDELNAPVEKEMNEYFANQP